MTSAGAPEPERDVAPGPPVLLAVAGAAGVVAVTTGLAFLLHRLLPHASLSLLFLTGVLVVSARLGLRAGLLAGVLGFLAYNFFFTTPYFTFKVDNEGDVATLAFYLLMATITGNLAARMHREARHRQQSLNHLSKMLEFSQHMSSSIETGEVLAALTDALSEHLGHASVVLTPDATGNLVTAARAGTRFEPNLELAETVWHESDAHWKARGDRLHFRLDTHSAPVGLVVIDAERADSGALRLARGFCDQAAIALDRTLLVSDLEEVRATSEREQLRSALLSSLSHDLRTPLASVIGSTSSVLDYGATISDRDRIELLKTTLHEARRLDRYIQNLLDMTRIGKGSLTLERNWVDFNDIVAGAVGRLGGEDTDLVLQVDVDADIPLLWVHGALIEQALVNLLDNAIRFTPPGERVALTARCIGGELVAEVCDRGPGIPEADKARVFEMFYTVGSQPERKGTGLGLAICHSMIAAHGGQVTARDRTSGNGTCMRIVLPLDSGSTRAATGTD